MVSEARITPSHEPVPIVKWSQLLPPGYGHDLLTIQTFPLVVRPDHPTGHRGINLDGVESQTLRFLAEAIGE
jgi:hypothetical protein